jgi:hypothetical protein
LLSRKKALRPQKKNGQEDDVPGEHLPGCIELSSNALRHAE